MTMDITKSVAFTGHRSERIFQVRMLYLYLDIVSQVKRLYSHPSVRQSERQEEHRPVPHGCGQP